MKKIVFLLCLPFTLHTMNFVQCISLNNDVCTYIIGELIHAPDVIKKKFQHLQEEGHLQTPEEREMSYAQYCADLLNGGYSARALKMVDKLFYEKVHNSVKLYYGEKGCMPLSPVKLATYFLNDKTKVSCVMSNNFVFHFFTSMGVVPHISADVTNKSTYVSFYDTWKQELKLSSYLFDKRSKHTVLIYLKYKIYCMPHNSVLFSMIIKGVVDQGCRKKQMIKNEKIIEQKDFSLYNIIFNFFKNQCPLLFQNHYLSLAENPDMYHKVDLLCKALRTIPINAMDADHYVNDDRYPTLVKTSIISRVMPRNAELMFYLLEICKQVPIESSLKVEMEKRKEIFKQLY